LLTPSIGLHIPLVVIETILPDSAKKLMKSVMFGHNIGSPPPLATALTLLAAISLTILLTSSRIFPAFIVAFSAVQIALFGY